MAAWIWNPFTGISYVYYITLSLDKQRSHRYSCYVKILCTKLACCSRIVHMLYKNNFDFSAVIFLLGGFSCAFTGTSLLWGSLSFTSNLSSAPGTIPLPPFSQSFTPLFRCLCSTSSSVSFVSAPSSIFLLLRWFESSSRVAVGINVLKQLVV